MYKYEAGFFIWFFKKGNENRQMLFKNDNLDGKRQKLPLSFLSFPKINRKEKLKF